VIIERVRYTYDNEYIIIILYSGKSFLLNFFLRYLKNWGSDNWIGNQSSPLNGFKWRKGTEGITEGILLWSEPFVVPLLNPSGESNEVAIVLMDTQGMFSRGLPLKESITVFALSTLLSSVQGLHL
jgi:atlastin